MHFFCTLRHRLALFYGFSALAVFGLVFLIRFFIIRSSFYNYVEGKHTRIGKRLTHAVTTLLEMNEPEEYIQRMLRGWLRGMVYSIHVLDNGGNSLLFVTRSRRHRSMVRQQRRDMRERMPGAVPRGILPPPIFLLPPRSRPRYKLRTMYFPYTLSTGEKGSIQIAFHTWKGMLNTVESIYMKRMSSALIFSALGAILCFSLLAFLFARSISRPLERIAHAAGRVAEGDHDISLKPEGVEEIQELAASFNSMAAALAEKEVLQKRMTSDVAHELRTPLTILKSYLEGISEGVMRLDRATAESLLEETRRLERIINDLRTIWELEKANEKPSLIEEDLALLLQDNALRIEQLARKAGSSIETDLPGSLKMKLDPELIMRSVNNLLVNAVGHAGQGGVITLSLRQKNRQALIEISDNGPGIPEEDLPHIFERFYRPDSSRYRETGGAGLGLAIARESVRSLGGRISARNNNGKGCIFRIELPIF